MPGVRSPGSLAATSLVVASMIGTGIFSSLGFQLDDFSSGPQILFLWLVGGVLALCGALCYAAVAGALPRSGGEHHFLTELYHPALGFMAGVLSAVVGFAAPTALTAIAFGEYLHKAVPDIPVQAAAAVVIVLGCAAHSISSRTSAGVQVVATSLKLLLILSFIAAATFLPGKGDIRWEFDAEKDFGSVLQPAFATALFYVFYAYSGWNAAVYGLEEWKRPARTVRNALVVGTLLVTLLYLGLNISFLRSAPVGALTKELAVGEISARHLLGDGTGSVVAVLFAAGLFASVSALLWAGPRVLSAMGKSVPALARLHSPDEAPRLALGVQAALAITFVFIAKFRDLVAYTQTGLAICTLLTVAGLFRLRGRKVGEGCHRPGSWLIAPACLFIGMTGFVVIRSLADEPLPTVAGLATAGIILGIGHQLTERSPA